MFNLWLMSQMQISHFETHSECSGHKVHVYRTSRISLLLALVLKMRKCVNVDFL